MKYRVILSVALVSAVLAVSALAVEPAFDGHFNHNRSICRMGACVHAGQPSPLWIPVQATVPSPANGPMGRWHLVRTPGPEKNGHIVSIMHTAEALQSDPEFAGMVIRCLPKSVLQIAFVLITPFPPRTHPNIAVAVNHVSTRFKGEVIPPGSMVALPNEAQVLARGPWLSADRLVVEIEGSGTKIHGVVLLKNLSGALLHLQANCSAH